MDWRKRFTKWPLPYDYLDAQAIEAHGKLLIGHTLRPFVPGASTPRSKGKGNFGLLLEKYYFYRIPDASPTSDFPEAGVELKSSPLKLLRSRVLTPKERLVLGMIDYDKVRLEEWSHSSFLSKNSHLLLVLYLYEKQKSILDYAVKIVTLWKFPEEDLRIIRRDWEYIVSRIREDTADQLSEGDTLYLAACTKAAHGRIRRAVVSGKLVKPRAFALKQGYLRYILHRHILRLDTHSEPFLKSTKQQKRADEFEDLISERFTLYLGKTAPEIAAQMGLATNPKAKSFHAAITRKILGISPDKAIEEFQKAEIIHRTIRVSAGGKPQEDVSFPAFKPAELVEERWENSVFRSDLLRRFFFVIYRQDTDGEFRLWQTKFWSMPARDRETHARWVWEETISRIQRPRRVALPARTENPVSHVRPHGRNREDRVRTPGGWWITRQCFWLNASYLHAQLEMMKQ